MATALRLGVFGLQKSQTKMGEYVRWMNGRLGKAEGLTAAADKLCGIVYGVIQTQRACEESEAFKIAPRSVARRRHLEKQAASLGLQLIPAA